MIDLEYDPLSFCGPMERKVARFLQKQHQDGNIQ